jgi:hypothetical protein
MADPTSAAVGDYKYEKLPDGTIVKLETKVSLPDKAAQDKEVARMEALIAGRVEVQKAIALMTDEQKMLLQRVALGSAMKGGPKVWATVLDKQILEAQTELDLLKAVK